MSDTWIESYTGKHVDILNFKEEDVDIVDIATALSNNCRYNGHCPFYSVAEHSIILVRLFDSGLLKGVINFDENKKLKFQRWALMHDAAEAYLSDIPMPYKTEEVIGKRYLELEDEILNVIISRFGLKGTIPTVVNIVDKSFALHEAHYLKKSMGKDWDSKFDFLFYPEKYKLKMYSPTEARDEFLKHFDDLFFYREYYTEGRSL